MAPTWGQVRQFCDRQGYRATHTDRFHYTLSTLAISAIPRGRQSCRGREARLPVNPSFRV